MRLIGFSTGALAYSDFRRGVEILQERGIRAAELSALRYHELQSLVEALDDLDLSKFDYIAFHAPSAIPPGRESEVIELLLPVRLREWPIVVHPDAIRQPSLWRPLGDSLCLENMDQRKPTGRTADELRRVFRDFPDASFCFDIGHAKQLDRTMNEARLLMKAFGSRLRQVHLSEVNSQGKHDSLSRASVLAFRDVAELIPEPIPIILETPVPEERVEREIDRAIDALPLHPVPAAAR